MQFKAMGQMADNWEHRQLRSVLSQPTSGAVDNKQETFKFKLVGIEI